MIRRSKSEKNTRAGIIDRDVNASTRAVSTEYCAANACTPSGKVYDRLKQVWLAKDDTA